MSTLEENFKPMRILVTGSRHGWDHAELRDALTNVVYEALDVGTYIHGVDPPPVLVHGAARGVDTQAEQIWRELDLPTEAHPYLRHLGKAGGPVRNQQMVDSGINLCLAFLDPDSKGTKDCVERAEKAGVTVRKWIR